MKQRLTDLLVCPLDKTPLQLRVWESRQYTLTAEENERARRMNIDPAALATEIITGVLINEKRKIFYPVHGGVPRMLTYPTGVAKQFAATHEARIAKELAGYRLPDGQAPEGEETVLRTFSSEWVNYDWNPDTYWNVSPDRMFASLRWMVDLETYPIKDKLALEVGIGIGGVADYMARVEGAELVGVDLGYAVDAAYKNFGKNRFLHIVQASAFAPPFRPETFDTVYSQGVIHHTSSTKTAFDQVCLLPKKGGHFYIWVYSPTSEKRSPLRRALMVMENMLRPLIWPLPEGLQRIALLPIVPLYLIHQNILVRGRQSGYIRYNWREAVHAARDRFTPKYAFRHSEEEVSGWFKAAGYRSVRASSTRQRPDYVPPGFTVATAVDGVRS
jgi:uncharacterized protein YbaR (Trm112 family)/SAM-dependent methyltransferase